jgi:hypothetical protein
MEPIKDKVNGKIVDVMANEWVCWACGYYDSDTKGFLKNPEFHRRMFKANDLGQARIILEKTIHVNDDD